VRIGESRTSTAQVASRLQRVLKEEGELWTAKGQSARLVIRDIECRVTSKGVVEIVLPFDCAPRPMTLRVRLSVATSKKKASLRVVAEDPVAVDAGDTARGDEAAHAVSAMVGKAFSETFGPDAREACFQALLAIAAERLRVNRAALRGIAAVDGDLLFVADVSRR
jgi:hypothetical protein